MEPGRCAKRRDAHADDHAGHIDLVRWLEDDGGALVDEYDRLYVPKNEPRWLRRNALVALGNTGAEEHRELLEQHAAGDDELLAEHAGWALERLGRLRA